MTDRPKKAKYLLVVLTNPESDSSLKLLLLSKKVAAIGHSDGSLEVSLSVSKD